MQVHLLFDVQQMVIDKPARRAGEPVLTKQKQSPTIHIYQGKVLTGDTLNRNAVKGGKFGYGLEPEYPAWVRSARSSPRTLN